MSERYKVVDGDVGVALVISGDEVTDRDVLEALDAARDEYLYGEPE